MVEIILMLMLTLALAGITGRLIVSPLAGIVAVINRLKAGDKAARVAGPVRETSSASWATSSTCWWTRWTGIPGTWRTRSASGPRRSGSSRRRTPGSGSPRSAAASTGTCTTRIGAKLTNIFFCGGVAKDHGPARDRTSFGRCWNGSRRTAWRRWPASRVSSWACTRTTGWARTW
ncbi:MAG: hypothetical protein M0C28_25510 [Candidatus Moduliflexus flocculans]|nr:hypothetical protein [Candidatus Moduliflexus flocculans]